MLDGIKHNDSKGEVPYTTDAHAKRSIVISTADHFLARLSQQYSLQIRVSSASSQQYRSILTCSNCAEYDPFISIRGAYCSTIPLFTRLFICSGISTLSGRQDDEYLHRPSSARPQAVRGSGDRRQSSRNFH